MTEHHLEFISLKEAAQAHLSLHLSKCHIVGNHMSYAAQMSTIQLCLLIRKNRPFRYREPTNFEDYSKLIVILFSFCSISKTAIGRQVSLPFADESNLPICKCHSSHLKS